MDRLKRVNELLKEELGLIIKEEVDFEDDMLITVIGVDVSPTLEHANVRVSVFPEDKIDSALGSLKDKIYDIQQRLNRRLIMRKVPKIRFEIDRTEEHASRVEELLDKIEK
ncbi:MAG: 30S ribosome-binding factor RbfA [bacterium]|nr:30S ribosome-binding factor RbfA [bacterium]